MNWTFFDFAVAGGLLAALAGGTLLALRASRSPAYRIAGGLTALLIVMLIWANGAVGIIGASGNSANLMYAAIVLTVAAGAVFVRLRPLGMAVTLVCAAALQLLIGATALIGGLGADGASWPFDLIIATIVFALGFLAAAWLFRRSASV